MSLIAQDGAVTATSRFDVGVPGNGAPTPRPERSGESPTARFGLWLLLGTIAMLFIGFTSALLVRRASSDWVPFTAPALLWLNTAALAVSSVSLELARRALRAGREEAVRRGVGATGMLGALFVAGQFFAWKRLAAQGLFLSANPHSDFFYMLTGTHIVHVAAALVWFCVVLVKVMRRAYAPGSDGLGLFATFWHFLGLLWAYLLFVLFVL